MMKSIVNVGIKDEQKNIIMMFLCNSYFKKYRSVNAFVQAAVEEKIKKMKLRKDEGL